MNTRQSPSCQSPFWYAFTGFVTTPLLVFMLVAFAFLAAILWPVTPFLLYFDKKKQMALSQLTTK